MARQTKIEERLAYLKKLGWEMNPNKHAMVSPEREHEISMVDLLEDDWVERSRRRFPHEWGSA